MLRLEIYKALKSRLRVTLLFATLILFPVLLKAVSHLSATVDNVPEGLFEDKVAQSILVFSQSYFFIPVWILLVVGIEFSNGHVNKIVFEKSRVYYFDSKLLYCFGVTLLFTLLAALTFVISVQFSPYQFLSVDLSKFVLFILQFAISSFVLCVILMMLVLILRSPAYAFIVYLGWTLIESILVSVFKGVYDVHLKYLPMQLSKSLYLQYEGRILTYYNPLKTDIGELVIPIVACIILVVLFRSLFSKTQIKALTD